MKRALDLLSAVFANPASGAPLLDELRGRWHELAPDERAALTPLAKLAAERVKAAPKDDPDGYWASLEADAPPEEEWSPAGAGVDEPRVAPLEEPRAASSEEPPSWRRDLPPATPAGRAAATDQGQLAFGGAPATPGRNTGAGPAHAPAGDATRSPAALPARLSDATPESLLSLLDLGGTTGPLPVPDAVRPAQVLVSVDHDEPTTL